MKSTIIFVILIATAPLAAAQPNFREQLTTKASAWGTSAVGAGSSCSNAENKVYEKAAAMAEARCQNEQGQHLDKTTPYSFNDSGTVVSGVGPAASYAIDGCGYFYSTVEINFAYNCVQSEQKPALTCADHLSAARSGE